MSNKISLKEAYEKSLIPRSPWSFSPRGVWLDILDANDIRVVSVDNDPNDGLPYLLHAAPDMLKVLFDIWQAREEASLTDDLMSVMKAIRACEPAICKALNIDPSTIGHE